MSDGILAHEWDYDRLRGMAVYSADDRKVGTIDQILRLARTPSEHYLLVRRGVIGGVLGQADLYLPESSVRLIGQDRVVLRLTAEELEHPDWTREP